MTRPAPGDDVVLRHVIDGRTWWAAPVRVVEDTDERVVLWWPAGTVYWRPGMTDRLDGLRRLADRSWELVEATWWGGDALQVMPAGSTHSVWPYRDTDQDLVGWYCNIQEPLRRTDDGFATNDWTLDVVAAPDLSSWQWKDEDELVEGERLGLYSAEHVERIHAAGDEVVAMIERRDPIFDEWRNWRPPVDWAPPRFPSGFSA